MGIQPHEPSPRTSKWFHEVNISAKRRKKRGGLTPKLAKINIYDSNGYMSTATSAKIFSLFKQDIGQRIVRSDDERSSLFKAAQDGDRAALNRLIKDNAWLVIKIAWRYVNLKSPDTPWVEINDLIQVGCEGMTRAIEKFDPDKGKFSNYVGHWIRQRIEMYLARNERFISLPREVCDLVLKSRRRSVLFFAEHGHYPVTLSEAGFNENEARIIKMAEQSTLGDFYLVDHKAADDLGYIYYDQVRGVLEEAIVSLLTKKEAEVIRSRWLNGSQPTRREVAAEFQVSKQAIADREKRALSKLREGLIDNLR